MFYDIYCELCAKKNVAPTRAALDMGMSKSTPTTWKNMGTTPQAAQLNKIADYFGVSVDYLLTGEETEKAPAQGEGELEEMLEYIRRSPELRTMFSLSKKATPDELRQYIKVIKAIRGED